MSKTSTRGLDWHLCHDNSEFRKAKRAASERFLGISTRGRKVRNVTIPPEILANLVGIGVAEKRTSRKPCGTAAVTFYVERKLPKSLLTRRLMLPRTISGIECDVVACGKIRPASATSPSAPLDPLTPGAQIQLKGAKAGTLGAFVRDADGDVCLISNCHVLSSDLASAGQPVYQPGVRYSGSRQIATVKNVAPISASDSNLVDVGLAKLDAGVQYQPAIPEIGALNGTGTPSLSEPVAKFGQATLDTLGDFVSIDADITVPFDFMTAHFANVYAFQPSTFADVGDSGSTIVEQRTGKAVGLLFAVGPLYKFAIPTQAIDGAFPGLTWL